MVMDVFQLLKQYMLKNKGNGILVSEVKLNAKE